MTTPNPSTNIKTRFDDLVIKFQDLKNKFEKSSKEDKIKNENIVLSIGGLISFLRLRLALLDTANSDFLLSFNALITFLLRKIEDVKSVITITDECNYVLTVRGTMKQGSVVVYNPDATRLDSIVYYPDDTISSCPVIPVLVPDLDENGNYKIINTYDATNGVLSSDIDMELLRPDIFNSELGKTKDKPDISEMIKSIIQVIMGQVTITEFSVTGKSSNTIYISSNPLQSQPPSTFAYGAYKNLKTAITDKNIKLTLKIHNPTQAFKITHLINVPQTYSNCYAHKDPNYEKI